MRLLAAVVRDAVVAVRHGELRLSRDSVVAQRDVEERGDLRAGALLLRRHGDAHRVRRRAVALMVRVAAGVRQQTARLLTVVLRVAQKRGRLHFVSLNISRQIW